MRRKAGGVSSKNLLACDAYNIKPTFYVYTFYGYEGLPIYIGKTKNLKKRIVAHTRKNHTQQPIPWYSVQSIKYYALRSDADMDMLEVYLISKYKPIYNKDCKSKYPQTLFNDPILPKEITFVEGFANIKKFYSID